MKSIGITDLRRNLSKVLQVLNATKGVILITRRGKPVAVLMSIMAFENQHDVKVYFGRSAVMEKHMRK